MLILYTVCAFLLAYIVGFFFLVIDPSVTQGAALALAGALSVPLTQIIKKAAGFSSGAAFLVAATIAAVLSVAAVFVTGQYHGVKDLIASATIVFTIGQGVFKVLLPDQSKTDLTPNDLK